MLSATLSKERETDSSTLQDKIREAKAAIDRELGVTRDMQYRRALVTTAYALTSLEEQFSRNGTAISEVA